MDYWATYWHRRGFLAYFSKRGFVVWIALVGVAIGWHQTVKGDLKAHMDMKAIAATMLSIGLDDPLPRSVQKFLPTPALTAIRILDFAAALHLGLLLLNTPITLFLVQSERRKKLRQEREQKARLQIEEDRRKRELQEASERQELQQRQEQKERQIQAMRLQKEGFRNGVSAATAARYSEEYKAKIFREIDRFRKENPSIPRIDATIAAFDAAILAVGKSHKEAKALFEKDYRGNEDLEPLENFSNRIGNLVMEKYLSRLLGEIYEQKHRQEIADDAARQGQAHALQFQQKRVNEQKQASEARTQQTDSQLSAILKMQENRQAQLDRIVGALSSVATGHDGKTGE